MIKDAISLLPATKHKENLIFDLILGECPSAVVNVWTEGNKKRIANNDQRTLDVLTILPSLIGQQQRKIVDVGVHIQALLSYEGFHKVIAHSPCRLQFHCERQRLSTHVTIAT